MIARLLLLMFPVMLSAQVVLVPGQKAPDFIVNMDGGSIQSFTFPYMKKIVYLQFWGPESYTSRYKLSQLDHMADRYAHAIYRNAEGFAIIGVCADKDLATWKSAVEELKLKHIIHGFARRGLNDEASRKFGVTSLPTGILIDENGIVLAVDPKMIEIENALDDRRNLQPVRREITGVLAQSSSKNEVMKFSRLYLFNHYGDSLAKTVTTAKGEFTFYDIKINQDFLLKVDNKSDIVTTDPAAIYTRSGEFLMDGQTQEGGFVFNIPPGLSNRMVPHDTTKFSEFELDVVKSLAFADNNASLTAHDEQELTAIVHNLQKSKLLKIEITAHTDTRADAASAMDITTKQVNTLKSYLQKKGVASSRISVIAKGSTEPRRNCSNGRDCTEEDHKLNRRIEIQLYKD